MQNAMDEFVHRANVANFKLQLSQAPAEPDLGVLRSLMAEEAAKAVERDWNPIPG